MKVVGLAELASRSFSRVIVPPDTPHRFVNVGTGTLRQLDIHVSPRLATAWLDD